eukprot:399201_1
MVALLLFLIAAVVSKVPEPSKYILSYPKGPNPLNITVDPSPEKNYFILLGDWGCSSSDSTGLKLQTGVAKLMKNFVSSQKAAGMNLLFVGTVGDNFYESGQNCKYWTDRWTNMYGPVATDYKWLAIFGNHDWGKNDPHALCAWGASDIKYTDPKTKIPYAANQINKDKGGCNPSNYYIPDFSYYYSIPELEFEWIGLEESANDCPGGEAFTDCGSQSKGCDYLKKMQTASNNMMKERAQNSTNHNFMLIQHYSGSGGKYISQFKSARGNVHNDTIWTAGGHSHYQGCVHWADEGVCDVICTGGGGHGAANSRKGFYVIGFDKNKKMTQPISINSTEISCMNPCGEKITKQDILESNFYNCCNDPDEAQLCDLYDKEKCKLYY